jgi:DNA mismatch repair protein MutL
MSRDDALLCLERHATSKIRRAEDLSAIATMGFRGEALPSIASVSRFTLTTRERDGGSPEATQIVINGGKILEVKVAGSAPGTSVEVRQIFSTCPRAANFCAARKRKPRTSSITSRWPRWRIPAVAFTFSKDGRWSGNCPRSTPARMLSRASPRCANACAPSRAANKNCSRLISPRNCRTATVRMREIRRRNLRRAVQFRIWGFIGAPGVSRSTREDQHLFVNRRPVENRGIELRPARRLSHALMKGRYPVCCLFLEIDPAAVDVNIHPPSAK